MGRPIHYAQATLTAVLAALSLLYRHLTAPVLQLNLKTIWPITGSWQRRQQVRNNRYCKIGRQRQPSSHISILPPLRYQWVEEVRRQWMATSATIGHSKCWQQPFNPC